MFPRFRFTLFIKLLPSLLLLFALASFEPVAGQAVISFGETTVQNNFPDSLVFEVPVSGTAGDIVDAKFHYAFGGTVSSRYTQTKKAEVEPGAETTATYVWDTSISTIPPSAPIIYYWEVVDSAGNKLVSEQMFLRYEDIRYNWQILENDQVGVLWHDRPDFFGKRVFAIAESAVAQQRDLFQVDLNYQILIVIYNDSDEFNAWQGVPKEWIGGQAFPDYGITTQIVPDRAFQDSWLGDVIPHEISHLYFAQVIDNPIVAVPVWLNEGVSQYNEFGADNFAISQVREAAKAGKLVPLSSLASGFGSYNEERIYLAYAESRSAIDYIVETYGEVSLAELLAAYDEGLVTDRAMERVFGRNMGEFESDWAAWLGAPEGSLVTPTPWPSPTTWPSPTPFSFPTPIGDTTRTAESVIDAPSTGAIEIAQLEPTTTPAPTDSLPADDSVVAEGLENNNQSEPVTETAAEPTFSNSLACLTAPLLIVGLGVVLGQRRSRAA